MIAVRIGVNCGSVDPAKKEKYDPSDSITPMLGFLGHCEFVESLNFERFVVSLKDSDPSEVIAVNKSSLKNDPHSTASRCDRSGYATRWDHQNTYTEQLIGHGIGDTVRVSLTPYSKKTGGD